MVNSYGDMYFGLIFLIRVIPTGLVMIYNFGLFIPVVIGFAIY
jgi:hypothetical protein